MSVVLRESRPVARKRYQCCLCTEFIEPGERHWYQVNIGEDWGFCAVRTCRFCHEQSRKMFDPWEEWSSEVFLDCLKDHFAALGAS